MARTQTMVQLSDELLGELDELRTREGRSRSELIREALEAYLGSTRRGRVDEAIVRGYTQTPPDPELEALAMTSARAAIAAEPWNDTAPASSW